MNTINCNENNFITNVRGRAGWWVNSIVNQSPGCDGSIGTDVGGNEYSLNCNGKVSGIGYNKGRNMGSIQFTCEDGTKTLKMGVGKGNGTGPWTEFMCPQNTYLTGLSSNIYEKYVGSNIKPVCKAETFVSLPLANSPQPEVLLNNSPIVPAANITDTALKLNNEESFLTPILIGVLVVIIIICFVAFGIWKFLK